MKDCGVGGSNPSRVNGSSVGRVHNIMARPVKSAVRIRPKKYFYPDFEISLRPEGLGYRRLEGGTTLCKKIFEGGNDIRLQSALPPYSLLNKASASG